MRDITNDVEKTETLVRLSVYDGSDWISFGNESDYERLYSISLNNSIDQSGWNLEARFRNHPDLESLDPYYDGTFKGLLAKYNKCRFEISKDQGSNWYTMFEGYSSETSPERKVDKDDTVIYRPIDPSKRLKDRIIPYDLSGWNSTLSFQNVDAFDAVDEILNAAGFSETINRDISDNPQKTIYGQKPYEPEGTTVWSAIQKIFEETGYNVLYRIDDSTGNLDLAVIDPSHDLSVSGRADSSDWDETWIKNNFRVFNGNFDRRELTVDDKDVRTKIKVYYQGKNGQDSVVVTTDNSSYAIPVGGDNLHREQIMNEPDNALIDSEAEARRLAQYTRDDLREPSPDVGFDFPFFYPSAQLTDIYRMGGTGDYTVDLFVTGIDHTIDVDRKIGTTSLSGAADRVIGKRDYWLNKDLDDDEDIRQRGDGRPPKSPKNPPRLDKSIFQVESSGETRASVVAIGEHAPEFDIIYYKWQYRIYNGHNWLGWENVGTSDKEHPQSTISSLAVGSDRKLQVRYAPIDRQSRASGGTAPWSPAQEILLNGDATAPKSPSSIVASPGPEKITITWTNPEDDGDGSNLNDLDDVVVYIKKSGEPTRSDYDTRQEAGKGEEWIFNTSNANTTYNIRLSSEDNSENKSELTDNITASPNAKVGDGEAPPTPTGLSVANNYVDRQEDGTLYAIIELNWDDIDTDIIEDFKGYELQQSTDNGSTWNYVSQSAPKASEATVKPLKPKTTYHYRIRAEDTEQNQSSWTSALKVKTAKDEIPPDTPEDGLDATPDKGSVIVEWDEVSVPDLRHYKVYVDTGEEFISSGTSFTYYGDYNTTYSFEVSAIDTSGNESAKAGPVSKSPNQIFDADVAFETLDFALDNLGDIPDGGGFARVEDTAISDGRILVSSLSGDLSNFPDANIDSTKDYGLIESTNIEAGSITLASAIGTLSDIDDDPDSADPQYARVKATYLKSGRITLAEIDGTIDDLGDLNDDSENYQVVSTTDITAGRIDLTYGSENSEHIKIGKDAIAPNQGGVTIADGTTNRIMLGNISNSGYGIHIKDKDGKTILKSTSTESTGKIGDTYISELTADSITLKYNEVGGTKPPSDADITADNPQVWSWISGEKPPINADKTSQNAPEINYYGTTAPNSPEEGWLWVDTGTTPVELKRYDGSSWSIVATLGAAWSQVIDDNGNMPADNSTQNKTFVRPDPPSGLGEGEGDIWIDNDTGTPYMYDGAGWKRAVWSDISSDPNAPEDNANKCQVIRKSTEPDASNYSECDIWVDSDNGRPYEHNGKSGDSAGWKTTTWSQISQDSNAPDNNATVGANWGDNLAGIPNRITENATAGLNLTPDNLGFYNGTNWQAYISGSDGSGQLAGGDIQWDGTGNVQIEGSLAIIGGSGIGNLSDAGTLAGQDNADWSTDVTGTEKPEDGATVGSDWSSNLVNIPDRHTNSATAGLNLTSTYMGFHNGSNWQAYIKGSDGSGQLAGGDISWDGTGNVQVKGSITITNTISAGDISDVESGADKTATHTAANISGQGDLATKDAALVSNGDVAIDGDLAITGNIQSNDWDGTNGWKIDGSTNTIYAADFVDTSGSSVIKNGSYLGVKVVDVGQCGTQYWSKREWDDPTSYKYNREWTNKDFTIPDGKRWVVLVDLSPGSAMDGLINASGAKFADTEGFTFAISGTFVDSGGSSLGGSLTSGSYYNVDLRIYHYMLIQAGQSSNDLWASQRVFYQVLEIPEKAF